MSSLDETIRGYDKARLPHHHLETGGDQNVVPALQEGYTLVCPQLAVLLVLVCRPYDFS